MKTCFKLVFIFLIIVVLTENSKSQSVFYSQPLNSRTYLNPAIAGTDSTLNVSLSFIRQFYFIGDASVNRFAADQYVRFLRGGIALDINNFKLGLEKENNINISYAPHFELFNHKLSVRPGIKFGYINNQHPNYAYPQISMDSPTTNNTQSTHFINISSGLFVYTSKVYGGIALNYMNKPNNGMATINTEFIFHSGANFNITPNVILSPNLYFRKQDGVLGLAAKIKWFVLGFSIGTINDPNINAGIQFKYFKLGYSKDLKYPTHELHLIGYIPYSKKASKIKTIRFI